MECLEQTGSIRLLLLLSKKGVASLTELKSCLDCSLSAIYNSLEKLKEAGLIQEDVQKNFPRKRLISLTCKGSMIASKLEEIEKMMHSPS